MRTLCFNFSEIPIRTYHDILVLRAAVFVVEQNCVYQDVDEKDPVSMHVIGLSKENEVIATARIVPPGYRYPDVSIGRVVVSKEYRQFGYGKILMEKAIEETYRHYGRCPIRISAQAYLEKFYSDLGFTPTGKRYLEDNIPHLEMLLD
ncbi:MAG: GNAT family N-acetyltransferase [Flavobacteriales bacterium]|nr:MAG: GNAT family N-acetyltransferase [Flavobacteriales bacterium]